MPSPFPGMDPFLEGQLWSDFHSRFIAVLSEVLIPRLRPRYVAVIEERVYVEHLEEESPRALRPDVSVVQEAAGRGAALAAPEDFVAGSVAVALAMPESARETYLEIRFRESHDVVTVIELLSPSNKRSQADGRREYLAKRDLVLQSGVHLVEVDLLRGGQRLPMAGRLPPADYYVILSRAARRPMADVWPVRMAQRLPTIPVPLAEGDPDAPLDLQAAFDVVYDRAGYDYALDYGRSIEPAPSADEARWIRDSLATR